MGADETSKPVKDLAPQKRRRSRRSADLRPLARMKKALDKTERESHRIHIEEFEPEIPKGVEVSHDLPFKPSADALVKLPKATPSPASSINAEAQIPEVEWAVGRSCHTKRPSRDPRKILSH